MGLSASLTWKQKFKVKPWFEVIHKLTLKDVQDENFVSPSTVINFAVQLTASERKEYDSLSRIIAYVQETYKSQAWKKIGMRTQLVYKAKAKLKAVKKITELFPNEKGIVFTMTKEEAEDVSNLLGDYCVASHSGQTKKVRQSKLKWFKDGRTKARLIAAPKIFDEGVTIPKLSFGVLLSRTSTERQFVQSLGRLVRSDIPDKHAVCIRVYVKDTVDEIWMNKSQRDVKTINTTNYEELKGGDCQGQGG